VAAHKALESKAADLRLSEDKIAKTKASAREAF
jgi:hypothetical protein